MWKVREICPNDEFLGINKFVRGIEGAKKVADIKNHVRECGI